MSQFRIGWHNIRRARDVSGRFPSARPLMNFSAATRPMDHARSSEPTSLPNLARVNDFELNRIFLKLHDELVLRETIRTGLSDWASNVLAPSGFTLSSHHRYLLQNLDLVTRGSIKRLMVLMPPGSAKSTYSSVIFPIWWFIQHPRSSVIAVSHTAALVEHFSRCIHTLIDENRCRSRIRPPLQ